ncbi:MAG: hypothetical protein DMG65_15910 [Candidatus Angelobacter sp. Gp1-AA117]|nr:MAG: hypothetical protein DMG65_15910 [Candidatus Angelobacter sp. Gp1-AA117]
MRWEKKKLGFYVSDKCKEVQPSGKDFFDIRHFIRIYWQVLSNYILLVSESTAIVLHQVELELKSQGKRPQWQLEVFNTPRSLVCELVAKNKEEVARILLFLDPDRPENEIESLFVLREAVAQHSQTLYINLGARLWAEREYKAIQGMHHRFVVGVDDAIVLFRQNSTRAIDHFASKHLDKIMLFPNLILTSRTQTGFNDFLNAVNAPASLTGEAYERMQDIANLIEEKRLSCSHDEFGGRLHMIACAPGRQSLYLTEGAVYGMQDITKVLVKNYFYSGHGGTEDSLCHILACPGYHAERTDIEALKQLIKICTDPHMRVNLVLNQQTAEEWIEPPYESYESYQPGRTI